jgi:hypothetical protein
MPWSDQRFEVPGSVIANGSIQPFETPLECGPSGRTDPGWPELLLKNRKKDKKRFGSFHAAKRLALTNLSD